MTEESQREAATEGLKASVARSMAGEPLSGRAVLQSLGGVRGVAESLLPGLLFILTFAITGRILLSVIAPIACAGVALIVRVIRRENTMPALTAFLGIAISAASTLLTGRASDFFLPGLITNTVWFLALIVSVIIRWPLLGVVLGLTSGSATEWRSDQRMRGAAYLATYVWIALFAARLLVQVPLYLAGNDFWLGIARVSMGVPLFGLLIMFTWLIFRSLGEKTGDESTNN